MVEAQYQSLGFEFRQLPFLKGSPPDRPYLFKENPPAKQKRMEKRWGQGGTPRLCEALAELLELARNRSVR